MYPPVDNQVSTPHLVEKLQNTNSFFLVEPKQLPQPCHNPAGHFICCRFVLVLMHSPEFGNTLGLTSLGAPPLGEHTRVRTYNSLFSSSQFCPFIEKNKLHRNMGTYKIGGSSPGIMAEGSSAGGGPSKYT
jgi:hypothetical protein